MEKNTESLLERVRDLEQKIENGVVPVAAASITSMEGVGQQSQSTFPKPELPKAIPEDVKVAVEKWQSVIAQTAGPMKIYLRSAKLSLGGDNRLMVVLEDGLASDYFTKHAENKEKLEELLSDTVGKQIEVTIQAFDASRRFEESYVDLSKIIHMEIEEED